LFFFWWRNGSNRRKDGRGRRRTWAELEEIMERVRRRKKKDPIDASYAGTNRPQRNCPASSPFKKTSRAWQVCRPAGYPGRAAYRPAGGRPAYCLSQRRPQTINGCRLFKSRSHGRSFFWNISKIDLKVYY
jgi:hypothetical protein